MTIRIPTFVVWSVLVIFLFGAGTVAGAAAYRLGPYATMERRVDAARELISKRDERISDLEHSLKVETERANSAQDELQKVRPQLSTLQGQLASTEAELQRAKGTLGAAQTRLRQTEQQAQAAKRQVETQTQLMLSQEKDIYVLRTCLRGVVVSLNYMAEGDDDSAIRTLDAVGRECRAAGRLL